MDEAVMGQNEDIEKAVQQAVQYTEISGQLKRIEDGITNLNEKSANMAQDITKIKDAIYGPDEGIYARLKSIEAWKATTNKILWFLFTAVSAGIVTLIINLIK